MRRRCTVFGGGCTKQVGEAVVHHFIMQQSTLFLEEWGVMRGNESGVSVKRGERQQERREVTREAKRNKRGMA